MQRTPLYAEHESLGAKIIDFHGWALPVQYEGIIQEHNHTRTATSVFDCSHMGEFEIRGADAVKAYSDLIVSKVASIKNGRARYGALLTDEGTIIDDVITFKFADDDLYVVTNGGPLEEVSATFRSLHPGVKDVSEESAKIDVQGPGSRDVLLNIGLEEAGALKYFNLCRTTWQGTEIVLSRTGYTGELGYEVFMPNELAVAFWRAVLQQPDVKPAALGARDTLRTEVGYGLSGQDFDNKRTPLEANMESFIAWDTPFRGKNALEAQRASGEYPRLTAIRTADRRAPRHDFEVKKDGAVVGVVTSGTFGPSVGHGIGLAYLPVELTQPGVQLTCGPRDLGIETAELPFYKDGTCRN
jgi:aminomethyltransferase